MTTAPFQEIVIGLVCLEGRLLISKRKDEAHLGGYWEFPGGKPKPGEEKKQALKREIMEELALDVTVGEKFCDFEYDYADRRLHLHFYWCATQQARTEARALEVAAFRWVRPAELDAFRFPSANREILAALRVLDLSDR